MNDDQSHKPTPTTGLHMQRFGRALRASTWVLQRNDPCDEWLYVHPRSVEPYGEGDVWYRGWEAGWDRLRDHYTGSGYVAYKGGCDLDAQEVSSGTWKGLLDEIDAMEDD
jgi:hypothetical protein